MLHTILCSFISWMPTGTFSLLTLYHWNRNLLVSSIHLPASQNYTRVTTFTQLRWTIPSACLHTFYYTYRSQESIVGSIDKQTKFQCSGNYIRIVKGNFNLTRQAFYSHYCYPLPSAWLPVPHPWWWSYVRYCMLCVWSRRCDDRWGANLAQTLYRSRIQNLWCCCWLAPGLCALVEIFFVWVCVCVRIYRLCAAI